MPIPEINFLAVVVLAVGSFVLGWLWYSPILLGNQWTSLQGLTDEQLEQLQKGAGSAYAVTGGCQLVTSLIVAVLVYYTGATTALHGAAVGGLCWLGFPFAIGLSQNVFSQKHVGLFLIDASYQLVYLVTMGAVLAVWK